MNYLHFLVFINQQFAVQRNSDSLKQRQISVHEVHMQISVCRKTLVAKQRDVVLLTTNQNIYFFALSAK